MALTLPTEQIETRQLTLAAAAILPKKKKEKNFPSPDQVRQSDLLLPCRGLLLFLLLLLLILVPGPGFVAAAARGSPIIETRNLKTTAGDLSSSDDDAAAFYSFDTK